MKTLLSIQSQVSFGAVGNTVTSMVAAQMNIPLAAVNTINLVTHPGYGIIAGGSISDTNFKAILTAMPKLDFWDEVGLISTGYMARQQQVHDVAEMIKTAASEHSALPVLIDPAFGDHGRLYGDVAIADAIRSHLLPLARITTPNCFEAAWLTGIDIQNADDAKRAALTMLNTYPQLDAVIITGIIADAANGAKCLDIMHMRDSQYEHKAPKLIHHPQGFSGGGDLFAALLASYIITGNSITAAFTSAAQQTSDILQHLDHIKQSDITGLAIKVILEKSANKLD
jgi:pyridoxine kinase